MLALFANQLHEMGFHHMRANSLKHKHVEGLLDRWKAEDLFPATIKNRLAVLRWWAEKIGKESVVARDNDTYGVERRQNTARKSFDQSSIKPKAISGPMNAPTVSRD